MAARALRRLAFLAVVAMAAGQRDDDDDIAVLYSDDVQGTTVTASPTPAPSMAASASPTAMPGYVMYPAPPHADFNGTDTPSPNEPIPKPECNVSQSVAVRYSATTARLYLEAAVAGERGGCVTLEQIWTARGGGTKTGAKAPLYAVDPMTGEHSANITGTWLLEEDLYVEDGITLRVRIQCS